LILSHRFSFPSARLLTNELSALTGVRWGITTDPSVAARGRGRLIRFGNSEPVYVGSREIPSDCNSVEFIQLCSHKLRFSRLLIEEGFYTPLFRATGKPYNFPALIRTTLTGTGGQGIIKISNEEEFDRIFRPREFYWTEYVPTTSEYRVHILGGNILKVFKKLPPGGEEGPMPIRNSRNGYNFSLRPLENHDFSVLKDTIGKLTEVLKGKFYGLDIGWDAEKKAYIIFEANSAPGLNSVTSKEYAEFIANELRS